MIRRILGRTGWSVGEVACGTYRTFDVGGRDGQAKVNDLVQANLDVGVNLFDTAPMYGRAEQTLGEAVLRLNLPPAAEGGPYIATKVLQHDLAGARRQIERSFGLLHRIDLLQIHNMAGWRQVLPYLAELKAEGRIGATGITHYDPGAFGEMAAACRTGQADVIQVPYNLIDREVEQRLLPLAREMNLGVLVMTPIQPLFQRRGILQRLEGLDLSPYRDCGVHDAGGLCLKYLLDKHPDLVLLPATSRVERVRTNAAVSGTPPLPPAQLAELERVAG